MYLSPFLVKLRNIHSTVKNALTIKKMFWHKFWHFIIAKINQSPQNRRHCTSIFRIFQTPATITYFPPLWYVGLKKFDDIFTIKNKSKWSLVHNRGKGRNQAGPQLPPTPGVSHWLGNSLSFSNFSNNRDPKYLLLVSCFFPFFDKTILVKVNKILA